MSEKRNNENNSENLIFEKFIAQLLRGAIIREQEKLVKQQNLKKLFLEVKQNTIRRNHSGNLIFRECIVQFLRVSIIRVQEELPKRQNVKQNSPGK